LRFEHRASVQRRAAARVEQRRGSSSADKEQRDLARAARLNRER
jgi:hypothetical protein